MGINGISSGYYPAEYGNKILQDIKNTDNPVMKAIRLSVHLSNMLKENQINIYEAYLLQGEIIHYRREGYTLPAWNDTVQISTCLAILNQRLLALAFKDDKYAGLLKELFPYHYYEPEKILLDKQNLQNIKNVSKNIETLLVELNT